MHSRIFLISGFSALIYCEQNLTMVSCVWEAWWTPAHGFPSILVPGAGILDRCESSGTERKRVDQQVSRGSLAKGPAVVRGGQRYQSCTMVGENVRIRVS
jgi:hypothetical protein